MAIVSLTAEEARVLGCLMEKSVTTPDNYPLSLNALVTACNQTTNREPIVQYDENLVERALDSLREKELTRRVKAAGQRVIKQTIGQDLPEGFQTAEFVLKHGMIDIVVERKQLKDTLLKLLKFFSAKTPAS